MNRYETSIPRAAFGIAAVAMTAITVGLAVVAPAKLDSGRAEIRTPAVSGAVTPAPTEVAISPARIDVVAVREPKLVSVQVPSVQPKRKQPG
jgi:hypothetical protein